MSEDEENEIDSAEGSLNLVSPEAIIMLPIAITLDLVGIILVCFALDDFFITDIIGWLTLGVWSAFRSQIRGDDSTEITPDIKNRKEQNQQLKQKFEEFNKAKDTETAKTAKAGRTAKTAKAGKWAKWIRLLEFIPYVGVVPFWTISTIMILKEE